MKLLSRNYGTFQVVFLRYLFATLLLIPCMLACGKHTFKTRHEVVHSIRAIMLTLGIALYCLALNKLPLTTVITVNFTIPTFTLVLSYVFLKEKINRAQLIATLGGFIGILVTAEPVNTAFASYAVILLVFAAILFAGLDVINKKFVVEEGVLTMLFYTAIVALILAATPAWMCWREVSPFDWALFGILGIGADLLLYCILKAFQRVGVSTVAPFRYIEFLLSAVVGFLFFGEIPTPGTLLGACIIIPSTLYVILAENKTLTYGSC
jgi:drug/metabolite transporter (DMT)-like permease